MNDIDDLKSNSIVLIYPDGFVEALPADYKIFHMSYYFDLEENSKRFQEILNKTNTVLLKDNKRVNTLTYHLNSVLAREGVISLQNLSISEVYKGKEYLEKMPLEYLIVMPNKITENQKEIMNYIDDKYGLNDCYFAIPSKDNIYDISYDDAKKIYSKVKTKELK